MTPLEKAIKKVIIEASALIQDTPSEVVGGMRQASNYHLKRLENALWQYDKARDKQNSKPSLPGPRPE